MAAENPQVLEAPALDLCRAEIDTSAPFESVKEAANRFGGMGFWKPISQIHASEHENVAELEEQTAELERDLLVKERETLDVLKELESTKSILEDLKSKIQKEASETNAALIAEATSKAEKIAAEEGKREEDQKDGVGCVYLCPSEAPGFILLELKRAKLNLTKTTTDLACIRATIDVYNKRIEKERASLEKTRRRLSSSTSKMLVLEEELNRTKQKLEQGNEGTSLQKLSSEVEQFRKVGEVAKSQVEVALSEIEQTKGRIKAAKIRLIAARKMKEAARASEAAARAEMKALSSSNKSEDVTLTYEEYSSLISKAKEAEESCKVRVADTVLKVDEANVSKKEILKKIKEAAEEVKSSKKALEEALSRVETVNSSKLAVEEAVRRWRSEHGRRRRCVHSCTKFKKPSVQHNDGMRQTLSIGEILSRKLLLTKEYGSGMQTDKMMRKRKVSLGQMLSKPSSDPIFARKPGKENKEVPVPAKSKKFDFARISLLVSKQSKKKKNI